MRFLNYFCRCFNHLWSTIVLLKKTKPIYKELRENVVDGIVLQSSRYSCVPASLSNISTGNFHPIQKIYTERAMIIFRENVFKMLKDNNRISDTLIFKMRHWNHSGFSVNNEVYINKDNPEALERLAQYIVHSSFSADKIKYIEREKTGQANFLIIDIDAAVNSVLLRDMPLQK